MPELPEVETIAKQLDAVLVGKVFETITVYREKSAQSELGVLVGMRVLGVSRKGKMIIIKLQATSNRKQALFLLIHLKMTGQLIYDDPPSRKATEGEAGQLIFDQKLQIPNDTLQTNLEIQNQTIGK
jgi:formamidopyrimidine-DNA glycosylase